MALCLKTMRFLNKPFLMSMEKSFNPSSIDVRCLFSQAALGVDAFLRAKEKTKSLFIQIDKKFKQKMVDFTSEDSKNMVFTEDLKNMIFLAENDDFDIELVEKMTLKFNNQNKELRFGTFVFGPVVMRMYHSLNRPFEALKVFKNPELDGFFDQIMTYQVLMDLLYCNKMYDEVKEVFEIIKSKQVMGIKFHRNTVVLVSAACFQKNTPEDWTYLKNLWLEMNEASHTPMRKTITYSAALAIQQDDPHSAVELLAKVPNQNYVTIRNLKILALDKLNRPEDAILILKGSLEKDLPEHVNKASFCDEVIEDMKSTIEKSGNREMLNEFTKLEQQLIAQQRITSQPLSKLIDSEIDYSLATKNQQLRNNVQRSDRLASSFRYDRPQRNQYSRREGLSDA
ncbi:pentatricopeptide repeat-containing protein 2, mitochondrial [Nilaparvata lugens]|uniref:pentatricopeptide repeat-containing protein 2, mitochondrial n=1 Tax=Nilaparvata lugens TaxID=108931 RepID=UPI00193D1B8F|nr:pentatricopeptide repeat-containing protein 2, mitochondrial [Nilaparvata lugens]